MNTNFHRFEKTLIRPNGDKVLVTLYNTTYHSVNAYFGISVALIPKGKRKPIWDSHSPGFGESVFGYSYRCLSLDEREQRRKEFILQYVSLDELNAIRDEFLESMKQIKFSF